MTRINTIDPSILTDKWLLAEYRELPRIAALAKVTTAPTKYTLGTGHVKFFYDKGLFLEQRFTALVQELISRGYNPQYSEYRKHPDGLHLDWTPDLDAVLVNASRLLEKFELGQRHTIRGLPVSSDDFKKLLDITYGVR